MQSIFHPLSTFPSLLSYGLIGPTLLRWFVALFLIYLGRQRWFKAYKWTSVIYLVVGVFVGIGFYTQIVALLGCVILVCDVWVDKKSSVGIVSLEKKLLYLLCVIVLISLLFTGAGFFALDLPL